MRTKIKFLTPFLITLPSIGLAILQVSVYALIPVVAPKEKLGEYMGFNNIFLCIPQIISNLIDGYLIFPISIVALVIAALIIGIGKIHSANPELQV